MAKKSVGRVTVTDVAKAAYAPMGPLTDKFGVGLEAHF